VEDAEGRPQGKRGGTGVVPSGPTAPWHSHCPVSVAAPVGSLQL